MSVIDKIRAKAAADVKHVVLADYSKENAQRASQTLENAGFECSTIQCDLGSKEDILELV